MIATIPDRLYNLLPAVYRVGDASHGEVLRALAAVMQEEFQALEDDINQLYDNWFIETCDEWVVPYIGDLLRVQGLIPTTEGPLTQRAVVANTLGYRRRKGTAAVLERLARDVSGWPARAVEFFELLATTQHMNHVRLQNLGAVSLHRASQVELVNTPFETAAHTGDVRHIDNGRGKDNIRNVGLFLWRLQDYPIRNSQAHAVGPDTGDTAGRYTFSPLGNDAPLFNTPRTEVDSTDRAGERNVPAPLRRRALHDELSERLAGTLDEALLVTGYFGDPPVLQVSIDGQPVSPEKLAICDLSDPPFPVPTTWRRPPSTVTAGVDPVLGRIALRAGRTAGRVEVSYSYGFAGDLGGGPYDRRASVASVLPTGSLPDWQIGVTASPPAGHPELVATLFEAIDAWNQLPAGRFGVIAIMDSRTYPDPLDSRPLPVVRIPASSKLLIIAADWPEEDRPDVFGGKARALGRITPGEVRPHVRTGLQVNGSAVAAATNPGTLIINGLLVQGSLTVQPGNLGSLQLAHSTLVPAGATPTLVVTGGAQPGTGNEALTVSIQRSISGRINAVDTIQRLTVTDSIIDGMLSDGTQGTALTAADATIDTSTILGSTIVRTLQASNTIFTAAVHVTRRQTGCVRFSYLPPASTAPRRFHCQPAVAWLAGSVAPRFTSITYGHPGFAQLAPSCPAEISAGANNEGEMGAFHFLQESQRIKHLRASLDEYLRFGLEAGIFLVT